MDERARRKLAEIGRKGGIRSRRTLSPEAARSMVRAREARRAARRFAASRFASHEPPLPGADIVAAGLGDLARGVESESALLVSIAAPRLRLLGIPVPAPLDNPETRLQNRLQDELGNAAHGRYNSLVRRMVSFQRAASVLRDA